MQTQKYYMIYKSLIFSFYKALFIRDIYNCCNCKYNKSKDQIFMIKTHIFLHLFFILFILLTYYKN